MPFVPYIVEFVISLVSGLFVWFVDKTVSITSKYPLLLAYFASVSVLATSFYISFEVLFAYVNLVFPVEYLTLVGSFLPSNFQFCLSTCISVKLMSIGFSWSLELRKMVYQIAVDTDK